MNGRTRGRPQKRDDAATWLKAYLSGGRRPMKEIERVGMEQGYGLTTLRRAKTSLGFESCTMSFNGGYQWAWRNAAVIERDAQDSKTLLEEKVMHRLDEIERLAQEPKVSTSAQAVRPGDDYTPDNTVRDIPLDAVDEHGFLISSPSALGVLKGPATITVIQVQQRIRQLRDADGADPNKSAQEIFAWAYPQVGLPESMIATMIRRGLSVDLKRSTQIAQTAEVAF
jgi:hypothetical protein